VILPLLGALTLGWVRDRFLRVSLHREEREGDLGGNNDDSHHGLPQDIPKVKLSEPERQGV
jgi:hypothetical protein